MHHSGITLTDQHFEADQWSSTESKISAKRQVEARIILRLGIVLLTAYVQTFITRTELRNDNMPNRLHISGSKNPETDHEIQSPKMNSIPHEFISDQE